MEGGTKSNTFWKTRRRILNNREDNNYEIIKADGTTINGIEEEKTHIANFRELAIEGCTWGLVFLCEVIVVVWLYFTGWLTLDRLQTSWTDNWNFRNKSKVKEMLKTNCYCVMPH